APHLRHASVHLPMHERSRSEADRSRASAHNRQMFRFGKIQRTGPARPCCARTIFPQWHGRRPDGCGELLRSALQSPSKPATKEGPGCISEDALSLGWREASGFANTTCFRPSVRREIVLMQNIFLKGLCRVQYSFG